VTTPSDLTGNFDLCVEISDAVLSDFAASMFRDTTQSSAISASIPLGGTSVSVMGQATFPIDTASITAEPSSSEPAGATVQIGFTDASLSVTQPPVLAAPLSGTITATGVRFRLSDAVGTPPSKNLELDFTGPALNANVALDPQGKS
jgi:hypothetical protein